MGCYEDFEEYTDSNRLLQPYKHPNASASGNGLLYTSEMLIILGKLKCLTVRQYMQFQDVIAGCEVSRGNLRRHPTHTDYEAPDDYIGVIAAAQLLQHMVLRRIKEQGEKEPFDTGFGIKLYYNYNHRQPASVSPRFTTWLGRMPQFVAHLKFACNEKPTLLQRIVWSITLLKSSLGAKKEHDSWISAWLMVEVYKRSKCGSWLLDLIVERYCKNFRATWPNGIGELLGDYFVNQEHPLCKWGQGLYP